MESFPFQNNSELLIDLWVCLAVWQVSWLTGKWADRPHSLDCCWSLLERVNGLSRWYYGSLWGADHPGRLYFTFGERSSGIFFFLSKTCQLINRYVCVCGLHLYSLWMELANVSRYLRAPHFISYKVKSTSKETTCRCWSFKMRVQNWWLMSPWLFLNTLS